ncbi:hypothetical protein FORC17_p072 (plasmid) [Vibrio vulnificus]|nr:hypothetical protein FORC17_p072 [Vibrio vulnificus]
MKVARLYTRVSYSHKDTERKNQTYTDLGVVKWPSIVAVFLYPKKYFIEAISILFLIPIRPNRANYKHVYVQKRLTSEFHFEALSNRKENRSFWGLRDKITTK